MNAFVHPEGETPHDAERRERSERAQRQAKRAQQAIEAISKGANPGEESLRLANEYTDEMTALLAKKLRGKH